MADTTTTAAPTPPTPVMATPSALTRWLRSPNTRIAWDYAKVLIVIWFLAILARAFLFETFRMPSSAMSPTIEQGDLVAASKWPFGLRLSRESEPMIDGRNPNLGELVTFVLQRPSQYTFIKRVVGLQNDRIEVREGHLYRNGVQAPYFPNTSADSANSNDCGEEELNGARHTICLRLPIMADLPETVVPEGQVFVLSDQRTRGSSPHPSGLIPISALRSKPVFVWMSVDPLGKGVLSIFPALRSNRLLRTVR